MTIVDRVSFYNTIHYESVSGVFSGLCQRVLDYKPNGLPQNKIDEMRQKVEMARAVLQ